MIKVGSLVIDKNDSRNFYRNVYEITGFSFDRAIVRRVGHILPSGRLDTSGDRGVTHRTTSNLGPATRSG